MPHDDTTVIDILRSARLILDFTQGLSKGEFLTDIKTQSAVLHQILVLGEAVKRLTPSFRTTHPVLPWTLMAGMRDHLIHGYDTVDLDAVWATITHDIPNVVVQITPLTPQSPDSPTP